MLFSYGEIVLRVFFAMLIGIVIGSQRERTRHVAGLRTHMLVALSACIVMITGEMIMLAQRQYGGGFDPARMACQIIPGVGFLGAGTIIHERGSIRGVTTSASLWATACVSLCMGAGFYVAAFIGAACILIVLSVFKMVRTRLRETLCAEAVVKLLTADAKGTEQQLRKLAFINNAEIARVHRQDDDDEMTDDGLELVVFNVRFVGSERNRNLEQFTYAVGERIRSPHKEVVMIHQ